MANPTEPQVPQFSSPEDTGTATPEEQGLAPVDKARDWEWSPVSRAFGLVGGAMASPFWRSTWTKGTGEARENTHKKVLESNKAANKGVAASVGHSGKVLAEGFANVVSAIPSLALETLFPREIPEGSDQKPGESYVDYHLRQSKLAAEQGRQLGKHVGQSVAGQVGQVVHPPRNTGYLENAANIVATQPVETFASLEPFIRGAWSGGLALSNVVKNAAKGRPKVAPYIKAPVEPPPTPPPTPPSAPPAGAPTPPLSVGQPSASGWATIKGKLDNVFGKVPSKAKTTYMQWLADGYFNKDPRASVLSEAIANGGKAAEEAYASIAKQIAQAAKLDLEAGTRSSAHPTGEPVTREATRPRAEAAVKPSTSTVKVPDEAVLREKARAKIQQQLDETVQRHADRGELLRKQAVEAHESTTASTPPTEPGAVPHRNWGRPNPSGKPTPLPRTEGLSWADELAREKDLAEQAQASTHERISAREKKALDTHAEETAKVVESAPDRAKALARALRTAEAEAQALRDKLKADESLRADLTGERTNQFADPDEVAAIDRDIAKLDHQIEQSKGKLRIAEAKPESLKRDAERGAKGLQDAIDKKKQDTLADVENDRTLVDAQHESNLKKIEQDFAEAESEHRSRLGTKAAEAKAKHEEHLKAIGESTQRMTKVAVDRANEAWKKATGQIDSFVTKRTVARDADVAAKDSTRPAKVEAKMDELAQKDNLNYDMPSKVVKEHGTPEGDNPKFTIEVDTGDLHELEKLGPHTTALVEEAIAKVAKDTGVSKDVAKDIGVTIRRKIAAGIQDAQEENFRAKYRSDPFKATAQYLRYAEDTLGRKLSRKEKGQLAASLRDFSTTVGKNPETGGLELVQEHKVPSLDNKSGVSTPLDPAGVVKGDVGKLKAIELATREALSEYAGKATRKEMLLAEASRPFRTPLRPGELMRSTVQLVREHARQAEHAGVSTEEFVKSLMDKGLGVPMYSAHVMETVRRGDMGPAVLPEGMNPVTLAQTISKANAGVDPVLTALAKRLEQYKKLDPITGSEAFADPEFADALDYQARAERGVQIGGDRLRALEHTIKGNLTVNSLSGGLNNKMANTNLIGFFYGTDPITEIASGIRRLKNFKKVLDGEKGVPNAYAYEAIAKAGIEGKDFAAELGKGTDNPVSAEQAMQGLQWMHGKPLPGKLPNGFPIVDAIVSTPNKVSKSFYSWGDQVDRVNMAVRAINYAKQGVDWIKSGEYYDLYPTRRQVIRVARDEKGNLISHDPTSVSQEGMKWKPLSEDGLQELLGRHGVQMASRLLQDYSDLPLLYKWLKTMPTSLIGPKAAFISYWASAIDMPGKAGALTNVFARSPWDVSSNSPRVLARAMVKQTELAARRAVIATGLIGMCQRDPEMQKLFRYMPGDGQRWCIQNISNSIALDGINLGQWNAFGPKVNVIDAASYALGTPQRIKDVGDIKEDKPGASMTDSTYEGLTGNQWSAEKAVEPFLGGSPAKQFLDDLLESRKPGKDIDFEATTEKAMSQIIGGTWAGGYKGISAWIGENVDADSWVQHLALDSGRKGGERALLSVRPQPLALYAIQQMLGHAFASRQLEDADPANAQSFLHKEMLEAKARAGIVSETKREEEIDRGETRGRRTGDWSAYREAIKEAARQEVFVASLEEAVDQRMAAIEKAYNAVMGIKEPEPKKKAPSKDGVRHVNKEIRHVAPKKP